MSLLRFFSFNPPAAAAVLLGALLSIGCSSSSSGPSGGPVMGALDVHCKNPDGTKKVVTIGMCVADPGAMASALTVDADVDGAVGSDGGEADGGEAGGGGGGSDFGETMYNSEGDDDDCKYHVAFTVSAVRKDEGATFTVTVTRLQDGKPATGAKKVDIEAFLTETHPAPSVGEGKETGTGTGVYVMGPVKFDMSGKWTVRFHLFDDCADSEDSPHGHAAFYINVP
jgi:YtkA-like